LLENFPEVEPEQAIAAPLGVGSDWFELADQSVVRNRLALANDVIIACVGRITPRKGQLTLLQALAAPGLDRCGLSVVIAGRASHQDKDFYAQLVVAARNLKRVNVVFANDLSNDQIRSLFAAAAIFCLPGSAKTSAVEGFGLVFLEAAAQGTPSVAGAIGGVPEVIRQGETGLLVRADDPTELGAALALLLDDEALRMRMGEAAKLRASEFTWRRCAEIVFGAADPPRPDASYLESVLGDHL
jgi:glycosyltransferase involved in cell wall biosynthesis